MTSRTTLFCLILAVSLSAYTSAVSVSIVLQDDVTVRDNTITHSLKAFRDVQNVTVVDYFSDVKIENSAKENFLGKDFEAVKIEIGDLKEGENRSMAYDVISGNGTAMLGADIYYLSGEKHQLSPKEVGIDIKENAGKEQMDTNLLILVFLIILISVTLHLRSKR